MELATKVYNKLKEHGSTIGNASIMLIDEVLEADTYFFIQHYSDKKLRWYGSNFDAFGTPEGFSASDPCWQKIQRHGTFDEDTAIKGLRWISKKHPDYKFRLVKVHRSVTIEPFLEFK